MPPKDIVHPLSVPRTQWTCSTLVIVWVLARNEVTPRAMGLLSGSLKRVANRSAP